MKQDVVIVTGAGRGIGRAIAERFAKNGSTIVAVSRSREELDQTRKSVEQSGGKCHVHPADVSRGDEIQSLVRETAERFGWIDVLVNNASVAPHVSIEELDESTFSKLMAVNVTAVYHGCRAVWPVMKKQGGGAIVNISSIASQDAFPGFAAYGATKAWVNAWTKALAEEGRPHQIRVFAVAPGAVETNLLRGVFPDFPADQTLRPSDVADVVFALSQPDCRHATGATLFVRK